MRGSAATVRAWKSCSSRMPLPLAQALDCEIVDPGWRDVAPVVGGEIRAPDLDALGDQIFLDRVGAQQPWDAEERRELAGVAIKRCERRGDAPVQFLLDLLDRHFLKGQRMVLAVGTNGVAGGGDLADPFRIGIGL